MSTSTERNPTHVYTTPGVYSVTLTVFGVGGTDSYTRTGYITVNTPTYVLTATVYPDPGAATITGLGTYDYGDTVTLTATGTPKPPDEGYCDIVFIVDESGSMNTEHAWLTTLPNTLEAALIAAGIGSGANTNRYALVGFGGHILAGHKHTVGGGDWGTAAQLCTAAGGLQTAGGGQEDGYEAMNFAVTGYSYRANAVKMFVLITDEDRDDITGGVITKAGITSTLQTNDVLLAIVCSVTITDTLAQSCIGRKGTRTFKGTLVAPYYTETVLSTIVAGPDATTPGDNATVITDYVEVAEVVPAAQPDGGTEWDLNQLRNGGSDAVSFTAAFVDTVSTQIIVALDWTFSYWSINGTPVYSNPYSFVITGPTTIGLMMG
jgi:PKD repeat protein